MVMVVMVGMVEASLQTRIGGLEQGSFAAGVLRKCLMEEVS